MLGFPADSQASFSAHSSFVQIEMRVQGDCSGLTPTNSQARSHVALPPRGSFAYDSSFPSLSPLPRAEGLAPNTQSPHFHHTCSHCFFQLENGFLILLTFTLLYPHNRRP